MDDFSGLLNDSCRKMAHMGMLDRCYSIVKYSRCDYWNVVLKFPKINFISNCVMKDSIV
jgi:hypothetical protein